MAEDKTEHSSKEWKDNRDLTFEELYKELYLLVDQIGYDKPAWCSHLQKTLEVCNSLLARVDVTDLPWSAVYNTLRGHFNCIGWNLTQNVRINKVKQAPSSEEIKRHVKQVANFVRHWTPKNSECYSSRYRGKTYVEREAMEPGMDLSKYAVEGAGVMPDKELVRILSSNYPRRPYVSLRQGLNKHERAGRHWGQRKLLMNEIELLNLHAQDDYVMVYVGAAPCTHLSIVEDMFCSLRMKYVLIDPAPFHVRASTNIEARTGARGLFSDKTAMEFAPIGKRLIFVSNIRR